MALETYKGSIHISTWDRDEVDVTVRIEEDSSGWFPQPVSRSEVRIDASRTHIRLASKSDDVPWLLSGNVPEFHYTIRMPRRATLRIKDYMSDADISDLQADLDLETYKGSMRVRDLSGALHVNTYKGTVRADFLNFNGSSSVDTYKGTIELGIPRESGFDLRTYLQRRARLDSDFSHRAEHSRGPGLRLKSQKGSFRLIAR